MAIKGVQYFFHSNWYSISLLSYISDENWNKNSLNKKSMPIVVKKRLMLMNSVYCFCLDLSGWDIGQAQRSFSEQIQRLVYISYQKWTPWINIFKYHQIVFWLPLFLFCDLVSEIRFRDTSGYAINEFQGCSSQI